ncbi:phosphoadenosine phosphosulfate reductase [Leptolyngbya sp. PCC 6406]|uniref:phosphoadenosine phosphosulfate reductase n=1 Tax=Leptolyngbya sp. PCC 6406 TaxID=1173264 RepID=UPI0012DC733D|nr:phosphoadenosine phosphosulfate reductase [Leptolyngbya sp. PCC 6406]
MISSPRSLTGDFDLETLNQRFETATPQHILSWAINNIPEGLVQTSAFSLLVITDMLYRELKPNPPIPVLFLDTLHHFRETLETVDRAKSRYNLDLRVYRAKGVSSRETFAARYGEALWEQDIAQFHYLTKVEPLQRALEEIGVTAWITGRRREQASTREQMPILERDGDGRLKINPLANWSRNDVWSYTLKHHVPYNPLHDQGYASIGDEPLTTRVNPGEHERAGRWRGSGKTECGIHI